MAIPEQGQLDFGSDETPSRWPPSHPICILRWNEKLGMVESEWPELDLRARFKDWHVALEFVCHPVNDHVKLLVTTCET